MGHTRGETAWEKGANPFGLSCVYCACVVGVHVSERGGCWGALAAALRAATTMRDARLWDAPGAEKLASSLPECVMRVSVVFLTSRGAMRCALDARAHVFSFRTAEQQRLGPSQTVANKSAQSSAALEEKNGRGAVVQKSLPNASQMLPKCRGG